MSLDPVTKKPLTMTAVCPHCTTQFGLWRAGCPTCGWRMPAEERERKLAPKEKQAETRVVKALVEKKIRDGCILCRRRVKLGRRSATVCPYCNELIHVVCLRVHKDACATFQSERATALDVAMKEKR